MFWLSVSTFAWSRRERAAASVDTANSKDTQAIGALRQASETKEFIDDRGQGGKPQGISATRVNQVPRQSWFTDGF